MKIERAQVCAVAKSTLTVAVGLLAVVVCLSFFFACIFLLERLSGGPRLHPWIGLAIFVSGLAVVALGIGSALYGDFISDCRRAVTLQYPWWYWLPVIGRPLPPEPPELQRDLVTEFMRTASWNLVMDREQLLRTYDRWLDGDEDGATA